MRQRPDWYEFYIEGAWQFWYSFGLEVREVVPVTVRDSIVTSRGNFSQNGAIQVLDSVDSQLVANSFKSHPVRVCEDGVKPIKPEANVLGPGAGVRGSISHPVRVVIQKDTTKNLRRDSFVTGIDFP